MNQLISVWPTYHCNYACIVWVENLTNNTKVFFPEFGEGLKEKCMIALNRQYDLSLYDIKACAEINMKSHPHGHHGYYFIISEKVNSNE